MIITVDILARRQIRVNMLFMCYSFYKFYLWAGPSHMSSFPLRISTARERCLGIYADLAWRWWRHIDIAPNSLLILSAPSLVWFTYSLPHSLAANRLCTSRWSIIECVSVCVCEGGSGDGGSFDSPLTGPLNWFFRPAVYFPLRLQLNGDQPFASTSTRSKHNLPKH